MNRHRIFRAVVSILIAYLVLNWVVVDRWQLQGRVESDTAQQGLPDAWVLATFWADEFLINVPFQAHPRRGTAECMGTGLAKTDHRGRFEFDELALVPPLLSKRARIVVFKPGWTSEASSSLVTSDLLAMSPTITLPARRASGETQLTTKYSDEFVAGLDIDEQKRSDELFDASRVVFAATSACEYQHEIVRAAMAHLLNIARTFDERERVRVACRGVVKRLRAIPGKHDWPYDCENPPFKHQPSESARALEAKLEEKRRRWRELNPDGS